MTRSTTQPLTAANQSKKPRRAGQQATSFQNLPRNTIRQVASRLPITNAYRLFKTSSAAKPGVRNGILKPKIAAFEKLLVARLKAFFYKAIRRNLLDHTRRRGPRHPARAFNADPKTMTIVNQGGVKVTATWKELRRHWMNLLYNPLGLLHYDMRFSIRVSDGTGSTEYRLLMRTALDRQSRGLVILGVERDPLLGVPAHVLGLNIGEDPPEHMLGPKLPRILNSAVRAAWKEYNRSPISLPTDVVMS